MWCQALTFVFSLMNIIKEECLTLFNVFKVIFLARSNCLFNETASHAFGHIL